MQALDRNLLAASWRSWIATDMVRVGPYWLQLVWTFLFCAALAVVFTLLGFFAFTRGEWAWRNIPVWAYWYGKNLTVSLVIGYLIHGLFELGGWWLGRERLCALRGWRATLYFAGLPMLGLVVGWPAGIALAAGGIPDWLTGPQAANTIATSLFISLLLTFGMHLYFGARARQNEAEKRATEAQLRLLQAQMEPHFLFNTLANVQSLIGHEPAKAQQMLEGFTDYLRATLAQLRTGDSTVADELALAEAYLGLMRSRMEDRLQFSIEADATARAQRVPPLVLQPLVENAVQHGLEPKVEGGHVHVRAAAAGGVLRLEVLDDGLGPAPRPGPQRGSAGRRGGAGVALANLRERLAARYGATARFELSDAAPGTRAAITLPLA